MKQVWVIILTTDYQKHALLHEAERAPTRDEAIALVNAHFLEDGVEFDQDDRETIEVVDTGARWV